MPTELHRDTVFPLGNIVALANIVERVKFHHQMVHAAAWALSNGEAMMAGVDVHEIQRHRRPHEVSDPETQQVPIECKGRVDFGHHHHGMSHALRPSGTGAGACERAMTRDGTVGRSDATERSLPVHWDIDPARVMRPRFADSIRASSPSGLREQAGHMTASDFCAARYIFSCQAGAIHT